MSSPEPAPEPAIVIANGYFDRGNGKTAHGLVRGSERFAVRAVIDPLVAGRDAGEVLDGRPRGIPLVASLAEALAVAPDARWAVVGVATHGGILEAPIRAAVLEAVQAGLGVANGLHDAVSDDAEIAATAAANGVALIDLRKPRSHRELHFWHGEVLSVRAPRIAVLGTDCALGKRTTARMLVEMLRAQGLRAEMIYTGQTGWMQGARYGFVLDATLNDYVSGELEHAIVSCDREAQPDVMVIEGQSSLRNPSGPCGAELLLSGAAHAVILQHAPVRDCFEGFEHVQGKQLVLPTPAEEISLIAHYGARVLGLALNSADIEADTLEAYRQQQEAALGIPVVSVLEQGLDRLAPSLLQYIQSATPGAHT